MDMKTVKSFASAVTKDSEKSMFGKQLTGPATAAVLAGVGLVTAVPALVQARNVNTMGRISYGDGPARMTKSYTTGAVQAMKRASGGNYEVFSDMAKDVVKGNSISPISHVLDDYGANPAMISALYNMGG